LFIMVKLLSRISTLSVELWSWDKTISPKRFCSKVTRIELRKSCSLCGDCFLGNSFCPSSL
jgi:hypothetical protein